MHIIYKVKMHIYLLKKNFNIFNIHLNEMKDLKLKHNKMKSFNTKTPKYINLIQMNDFYFGAYQKEKIL